MQFKFCRVYSYQMSSQFNQQNSYTHIEQGKILTENKVKVTDLISRMNKEKKIEKKRNLALGVAAASALTVFGIILTL